MKIRDDFAEKLLGVPSDALNELTNKIGKYSANHFIDKPVQI
jgi:hypothetical protein